MDFGLGWRYFLFTTAFIINCNAVTYEQRHICLWLFIKTATVRSADLLCLLNCITETIQVTEDSMCDQPWIKGWTIYTCIPACGTHIHPPTHTHYTSFLVWSSTNVAQSTTRIYRIGLRYFQRDSSMYSERVSGRLYFPYTRFAKTSNVTTLFFRSPFADLTSSEISRRVLDVLRTLLGRTGLPRLFPTSTVHSFTRVLLVFSISYHYILWPVPFKMDSEINGHLSNLTGLLGRETGTS